MKKLRLGRIACMVAVFCVATAIASHAQTYTVVTDFNPAYGENPSGPLVQGTDGDLYGVTETGGNTNSICPQPESGTIGAGCGSVYKVSPSGTLTMLYEFCSQTNCADGAYPIGSLVLGTDGNLYGTTFIGGASNQGTVFKITPAGQLTTLYSFCSLTSCTDGALPNGGLVQGSNGSFYGTTQIGGREPVGICVPYYYDPSVKGCGTVFEISSTGKLTTLYTFCSQGECADGDIPVVGLTLGSDGIFYGTTSGGGIVNPNWCITPGCGTIFRMSQSGTLTTMYKFCTLVKEADPCLSGENPNIPLVQATDGNFYGAAGTIFSITPTDKLTVIHQARRTPGISGMIQATDGNFYATQYGGLPNCSEGGPCGDILEFQSSGTYRFLYDFCAVESCIDGALPASGLMQATNGILYGTTLFGGSGLEQGCNVHGNGGCGVVFAESLNLPPFVRTVFNFGQAGTTVGILGNNLTGTTSVTINGTAATFTVVSRTFIKATVPPGATTGPIQVITPSGTLNSNVAFQVLP
jgi:uncharacterized repeat protein (TIGR03803 family)